VSRSFRAFAANEVLYSSEGRGSLGVATGDMGIGKDGHPKDSFTRGVELKAKYTPLRRRGSREPDQDLCSSTLASIRVASRRSTAIGLKELWQVAPEKHRPGLVQHTFGWPPRNDTLVVDRFFIISATNLVSVGFVVHLNYANPLSQPHSRSFQRFKTHPPGA